jgi:UDP-N-acetylglucosamine pyrophosphorylase
MAVLDPQLLRFVIIYYNLEYSDINSAWIIMTSVNLPFSRNRKENHKYFGVMYEQDVIFVLTTSVLLIVII